MKFIIIFNICSQLYGTCLPPTTHSDIYATHYECATTGYGIAQAMMAQMGQDHVNNNQVVIGLSVNPEWTFNVAVSKKAHGKQKV